MKKFMLGVMALFLAFGMSSCSNVGPVVKVLKKINTESARYWISFLKENGIDAIDQNGNTILLMAVGSNDPKFVEACLKSGADVNTTSKFLKFPITIAVEQNNVEIAEMLLKKKASPNPRDSENCLAIAMNGKNKAMIDLLLKYKPELDGTVTKAIFFRSPPELDTVVSLDKAGYKPSPDDLDQIIQSYYLSEDESVKAKILELVKKYAKDPAYNEPMAEDKESVLTKQYARVDQRDTKDFSEGHIELPIVKALIESGLNLEGKQGAYTNAPTPAGWYISTFGYTPQFEEVVKYFIQHGFDINSEYRPPYGGGRSTLLYDFAYIPSDAEYHQRAIDQYQYLLSLGADPNHHISVPEDVGNTPAKLYEKTLKTE